MMKSQSEWPKEVREAKARCGNPKWRELARLLHERQIGGFLGRKDWVAHHDPTGALGVGKGQGLLDLITGELKAVVRLTIN